jgi:hypothetical protein
MLGDQGGQGVASNVPCGTGAVVKLGMNTLTRLIDNLHENFCHFAYAFDL